VGRRKIAKLKGYGDAANFASGSYTMDSAELPEMMCYLAKTNDEKQTFCEEIES
jgi:hypothetical protein